jgi:hypothetical protein
VHSGANDRVTQELTIGTESAHHAIGEKRRMSESYRLNTPAAAQRLSSTEMKKKQRFSAGLE